eukprot:TRINITY_DN7980_c0_g1_i4.p1 TRINITY_DN7980_c0_g1~~TRINITY_DN7980_c0_g1_i4.p1  ORF type:complete len:578 (+),score=90.05 TRINITY_DN7980_c0_g1_i4:1370-3103(+)
MAHKWSQQPRAAHTLSRMNQVASRTTNFESKRASTSPKLNRRKLPSRSLSPSLRSINSIVELQIPLDQGDALSSSPQSPFSPSCTSPASPSWDIPAAAPSTSSPKVHRRTQRSNSVRQRPPSGRLKPLQAAQTNDDMNVVRPDQALNIRPPTRSRSRPSSRSSSPLWSLPDDFSRPSTPLSPTTLLAHVPGVLSDTKRPASSGSGRTGLGNAGDKQANAGQPSEDRKDAKKDKPEPADLLAPVPPRIPKTKRPSFTKRFSSPAMLDAFDPNTVGIAVDAEAHANNKPEWALNKGTVEHTMPSFGAYSMGGGFAGSPKENQDGFIVCEAAQPAGPHLVTVLDGHGVNGRKVSALIENVLGQRFIDACKTDDNIARAIQGAIMATADELKSSNVDCKEAGSTLVSCVKLNNKLVVANVGDSRCVLGMQEGGKWTSKALSRDHKPDDATERSRIQRMGGFVEPTKVRGWGYQGPHRVWKRRQMEGGLALARSLGDTNLNSAGVIPDPELITHSIEDHDKLVVLGSDGVFDHLSNDQVIALASRFPDPQTAAQAVVKAARRRWMQEGGGYIDDTTCVVMKL